MSQAADRPPARWALASQGSISRVQFAAEMTGRTAPSISGRPGVAWGMRSQRLGGPSEAPEACGIAGRLEKATTVLRDAGALVGGGTAVVESLQRLGTLLGPAGHTLLALLSAN